MKVLRMKNNFLFILIAVGLLGGCSKPSNAGEYKLLNRPLLMKSTTPYAPYPKATDPSICKAYEKNLNSFPNEKHPMSCSRKINSDIEGFEEIEWKKMESGEAIDLLVPLKIRMSRNPVDSKERRSRLTQVLSDSVKDGILKFSIASFDINNDKKDETVIRQSYHNTKSYTACENGIYTNRSGFFGYYIFNVDSRKLIFNEKNSDNFHRESGSAFNIFRYNNITYLDTWRKDYIDPWQHKKKRSWYLKVYEVEEVLSGIAKTPICEYVYKNREKQ